MKKIIALVLALVMVMSLSTVAFADKKNNSALADIAAGMLYIPAQNLANVVELNHEKIEADLNDLSAQVYAAAYQLKTAVDNTVAMANGLVYTVAATYQLGGKMILDAARIIDGKDYEKSEFVQWIERCVANSEKYESDIVKAIAAVKEKIDGTGVDGEEEGILTTVLRFTVAPTKVRIKSIRLPSEYEGSFIGGVFDAYGPKAVEFLRDAENFLPGENVSDALVNIVNYVLGNKKVPD